MSLKKLREKYREILAAGIIKVPPFSYLEELELGRYINRENLERVISKMQKDNLDEIVAVGKEHILFILKIGTDLFLTCVALSSRPFGYCRKLLHQMARELD